MLIVPNSDLYGLGFFVCFICMMIKLSHLNDMEILGTNRFIPKGFELGTRVSRIGESLLTSLFTFLLISIRLT